MVFYKNYYPDAEPQKIENAIKKEIKNKITHKNFLKRFLRFFFNIWLGFSNCSSKNLGSGAANTSLDDIYLSSCLLIGK